MAARNNGEKTCHCGYCMDMQVSPWYADLDVDSCSSRAGSSVGLLLDFEELPYRYLYGCSSLQSHPLSPYLHCHLFLFLTTAILTGLRWNLIIVLTYISSMVKVVEHSSKSLLAIYIPSFEKRLSGSLVH